MDGLELGMGQCGSNQDRRRHRLSVEKLLQLRHRIWNLLWRRGDVSGSLGRGTSKPVLNPAEFARISTAGSRNSNKLGMRVLQNSKAERKPLSHARKAQIDSSDVVRGLFDVL